jgi:hypothetical protein
VESVQYIAADGTTLALTDYGGPYYLTRRRGFDAPPVDLMTERIPDLAGARQLGAPVRERTVALSIDVDAASWEASRDRLGTLVDLFMQGGTLEVAANGRTRRLDVLYAGGLDGDTGYRGPARFTVVPEFRALWPYWYDVAEQSQTVAMALAGAGVAFPITFPFFFEATGTARQFTLTGGAVAGPFAVEITGPLGRVQLARLDTNEVLDLTYPLGTGQTLRINTAVGERRALVDTGAGILVARGALSTDSVFWQLGPGATPCALVIDQANRQATFTWRNYYRSSN